MALGKLMSRYSVCPRTGPLISRLPMLEHNWSKKRQTWDLLRSTHCAQYESWTGVADIEHFICADETILESLAKDGTMD